MARTEKVRAGLRFTCVADHSSAHVVELGLKWENTDSVVSSFWDDNFVDGRRSTVSRNLSSHC